MFKYVQCTLYIYIVCVCHVNQTIVICHEHPHLQLSSISWFSIYIKITCWELFVSVGPPPLWVSLAPILKMPLLIAFLFFPPFCDMYVQMIRVISSQNLCQLRFFGFTNFPDGKVFATKKLVAARYGSGAKTASLQIWFFETKLREIAVQLFASSLYVHFMQRPPPDYYHLQSALKTAVPGSRPKYNIYTESRTRFVWTHLSFDQRKFRVLNRSWEQIFSRLKVCQNNFRQVLHRSKEKGEKQPILVNGIREVGTGKNIKHRNIISSKWMIIIFFSNKQNIAKIANAIQHHCTVYR